MGCKELSSSSCAEFGVPINWKLVSQGISVVAERKSSHLWCMMLNRELFWSHCSGIGLNVELIWATPWYFTFLRWHHSSFRLVRDFWGTLCTSVKQKKAPYLIDWEQGIALQALQGNRASSFSEWEVWWFFSSCSGKLGYFSRVSAGEDIKSFCLFSNGRSPI